MLNSIRYVPEEVSFPGLGIEGLKIDNVAFRIGSVNIYWYGVILALALTSCVLLAILHSKKHGFSSDLVIDIALVCFPSAIIGARLYYVLSEWKYYNGDIWRMINLRDGGLAVIGGVLAAILAGYILAKIRKIPAHVIFDYCIVYIPLGQAIGRWGNFFNQEAFGTNTTLPWGMISASVSRYLEHYCEGQNPNIPVHPTFLYESLATTALFLVLLIVRNKSKYAFTVTSCYLIFHGVIRFLIEGLRTDSLYIGDTGLRLSQVTSVMMALVGIVLLVMSRTRGWKRVTVPVDELLKKSYPPKENADVQTASEASGVNRTENLSEEVSGTPSDPEAFAVTEETSFEPSEQELQEGTDETHYEPSEQESQEMTEEPAEETSDDSPSSDVGTADDNASVSDTDGAGSDSVG